MVPPKFTSPEQFAALVESYFESITDIEINERGKQKVIWLSIPSMAALAEYCNCHIDTLYEYKQNYPGYSEPLKRAKQRLEQFKAEALYTTKNPAGVIFDLKANHGWQDAQQLNVNITNLADIKSIRANREQNILPAVDIDAEIISDDHEGAKLLDS